MSKTFKKAEKFFRNKIFGIETVKWEQGISKLVYIYKTAQCYQSLTGEIIIKTQTVPKWITINQSIYDIEKNKYLSQLFTEIGFDVCKTITLHWNNKLMIWIKENT